MYTPKTGELANFLHGGSPVENIQRSSEGGLKQNVGMNLILIEPGNVKVDLADFNLKLQEKFNKYFF
jgi:hypothetical protein